MITIPRFKNKIKQNIYKNYNKVQKSDYLMRK